MVIQLRRIGLLSSGRTLTALPLLKLRSGQAVSSLMFIAQVSSSAPIGNRRSTAFRLRWPPSTRIRAPALVAIVIISPLWSYLAGPATIIPRALFISIVAGRKRPSLFRT